MNIKIIIIEMRNTLRKRKREFMEMLCIKREGNSAINLNRISGLSCLNNIKSMYSIFLKVFKIKIYTKNVNILIINFKLKFPDEKVYIVLEIRWFPLL